MRVRCTVESWNGMKLNWIKKWKSERCLSGYIIYLSPPGLRYYHNAHSSEIPVNANQKAGLYLQATGLIVSLAFKAYPYVTLCSLIGISIKSPSVFPRVWDGLVLIEFDPYRVCLAPKIQRQLAQLHLYRKRPEWGHLCNQRDWDSSY